jgi:hypothetical protein
MISWLVLAGLLLAIFAGMGYVVKRVLIDKRYFGTVQFLSRTAFQSFQNADRRDSIEQVVYMEEEEKELDFIADDKKSASES